MTESEAKAYIEYLCESLRHFGAIKFDDKTISEYMDENRRVSEYLLALRKKRGEPEENDNGQEDTEKLVEHLDDTEEAYTVHTYCRRRSLMPRNI